MEGIQYADYVCPIFFIVVTTIVVLLRYAVRIYIKGFGADDWTMVFGHMLFIAYCIAMITGVQNGLGIRDEYLTIKKVIAVRHIIFNMELLYCSALMFIKTSIGCALLRINNNRYIKWAIYIVTFLSVSSGFVPLVVVSSICQPMSGAWTGVGKCRPFSQINTVVVFLTATSISTDVVYSVLPFIILWNLQMKQSKKLIIATLLSLTFISSGATIIRAFYIADFSATVNYPFRIAYPTLYSTIELGTGVIFASIPGVKPIYNLITSRVKKVDSRYDQSDHSKDTDRSGNGKYYTMEALNTAGPPSNDDEENLIHNKSAIKISSKYVV